MTTPQRIQLKRTKGWRMPTNTVKVDRTTKWGNPFLLDEPDPVSRFLGLRSGQWTVYPGCGLTIPDIVDLMIRSDAPVGSAHIEQFWDKAAAQRAAVEKFRVIVAPTLHVEELRGKNLACWCKPDAPCHADVLLELANPPAHDKGEPKP